MNATVNYRGRTFKNVIVSGITFDDSREDVINAALAAAGESRSSLFGIHVGKVVDSSVRVRLDTD